MSQQQPQDQTVVQESAKVLERTTDLPEGPNVGPSPIEHLAAQGTLVQPEAAPSALPRVGPDTPTRSKLPRAREDDAGH